MHKKKEIVTGIAFALLCVTALHFATPVHSSLYHDVYDRLYYIPVIFSAFFFGLRGGAIVAFIASGLFFMHLAMQWSMHAPIEILSRYLEIMMYIVVGIVTGVLSDLEKKQRLQTEEAYGKLKDSFEKAKESARLAAIGMVAAGVAHEIRNPLGGIKGAMEIISTDYEPSHPKHRFVEIIKKEIKRMENIVGEFLNFSRPQKPVLAPDNLNKLLRSVLDLCKKNISKQSISLETELDEFLPVSSMDSNQLKQVFLNVILNSINAMPDGGTLKIRSRGMVDKVDVHILDTGPGIKPDELDKLFEPFYTTKPQGTGLGLPICKQIVEQHGGKISIDNCSDAGGAVTTICLPIIETGRKGR